MTKQACHGLLVIDKPTGLSSRAAVDRVQRLFPRGTRIGHTGTLDPLATGVLVVCIGVATRLAEFVQGMPKTYRAGLRLGAKSDTDDLEGHLTPVEVERIPDLATVTSAVQAFVGQTAQVPPNYSAAKVTGRRAYELARRGRSVNLRARPITIYGIDILGFDYPRLDIEVRCGKGTYIRSLARDLGEKLECGALIETLQRTRVGPFGLEGAVSLDADIATAQAHVRPIAAAVSDLPRIEVNRNAEQDLVNGRAAAIQDLESFGDARADRLYAVFAAEGRLVAVGILDVADGLLSPVKVFPVN
jgi:tRNA pseudouridine55 synthase